jgi:Carboxypeptidase regulatory-like domain
MTASIRIFAPVLLTLLPALAGCDSATPSTPSPVPSSAPPAAPTLVVFTELTTGYATSDLRDAQDQIVQLNSVNELVWAADGARLPGYRTTSFIRGGQRHHFIEGKVCAEGCAFEVRFGAADGERRAYLTVDYGHDNPGTVVDVEVAGGELLVTQTDVYPPGSPTLSGIVMGMTARGPVPLEGVVVARGISSGWRSAQTDRNGFYEIHGLIDGTDSVYIAKDGYEKRTTTDVVIAGNTRLDIQLAEAPSP